MEDPRRLVDKDHSETFWVVGFEDFDHEFDRRVILRY